MPQIVEEKTVEFELDSSLRDNLSDVSNTVVGVGELSDSKMFGHTVKHPDEFYEEYISNFEQSKQKRYFYRFVKRTFDILMSLFGLIVAFPLFLIVAIAIKIDSRGPAIFKQKRIGKDGKVFNCLKFRSMKIDTPKDCPTSLLKNPENHYTKVGKFIRKFSIDELPQLWCVLIGKMSFIGYRPIVLNETECNDMRERLGVHKMRPGISGYAQVNGRDDLYYKNKAILDGIYVKNASILLDIKLIFKTVLVVLKREGNDAEKVVLEKKNTKIPEKETAEV